jgi:hypothetical protein
MRLLLDTHALILWHEGNSRLSKKSCQAIQNADEVFVSMVSAWEVAIKISKGRMTMKHSVMDQINMNHFALLNISFLHIDCMTKLPDIHSDPFDRLLIAQAKCEKLTFVTDDKMVRLYDIDCLEI